MSFIFFKKLGATFRDFENYDDISYALDPRGYVYCSKYAPKCPEQYINLASGIELKLI